MKGEQFTPEFLAVSPNNKMPAIVDDDPPGGGGALGVFESAAIGIRVEKPNEFGPAIQRALKADRPVIIDVVTEIEALAPLAVA